jgi:hypothetical protein
LYSQSVSGLSFESSGSDKNSEFDNGVCDLSIRGTKSDSAGEDPTTEQGRSKYLRLKKIYYCSQKNEISPAEYEFFADAVANCLSSTHRGGQFGIFMNEK